MRQTEVTKIVLGVLAAFERRGLKTKGVRISADGALDVLTDNGGEPPEPPTANDRVNWIELAGKTKVPPRP